jgi:hypothetical protein
VFSNERGLCIERRAAFFAQKAGTLQLQDRFLRLDRQDLDRRQVGAVLDDLPFVFDPAFAASGWAIAERCADHMDCQPVFFSFGQPIFAEREIFIC